MRFFFFPQDLLVVCDETIKREFEQKSPRLESTDNMKVAICFGLDNCSTAHLENPGQEGGKKIQLTRGFFFVLFCEQKFSSVSEQIVGGS